MALTASRSDERRRAAEMQALKLLNLTKEEIGQFCELQALFQKYHDGQERQEIIAALLEIINHESIAKVGDLGADISPATKRRVRDYHKQVGAEIRRRRLAKKLSQVELANLAGIPQSHVSRLECGQHAPTHITIRKLSKALNTRPKMLDPGFDD